jgi:hypothetical protein
MLPDYMDIRDLTDRAPDWFGEHGEPRYRPFDPNMLGVYDKYALLVQLNCQACSKALLVGVGYTPYVWIADTGTGFVFEKVAKTFRYGDPPRHGCIGDSMNSICTRIVEAWEQVRSFEWIRRPDIEVLDIIQEWATY